MDPLSVTASSLALLAAIKAAHLLINKIVDAPETLASAQSDIEFTISSVQALCAYLGDHSEATLIARGELLRVIDACTGSCDAFQHLLQECSKHSVERVDGKLSLLDRGKILLKDKSIREFRGDLACFRGAINIAAFPLLMYDL